MNIAAIPAIRTSDYANRDNSVRTIGYKVEVINGRFFPVVYGKTRDPEESAWLAMHEAKKLANKIAGSMREKGIKARAVQICDVPL